MLLKEKLLEHCHNHTRDRMTAIRSQIEDAQASANAETKSSAGDKHETGRAMAQLEVEMSSSQLAEADKVLQTLSAIKTVPVQQAGPGALVTTDKGIFFIAISIGKVFLDGVVYYIVSAESPVGQSLRGRKRGDQFTWNGQPCEVLNVQ
jgi:transcription elongation GreA/GreB family factor